MFEIEIESDFSAAHFLRDYAGDCSSLHGHNWVVRVALRADELDELGLAYDFRKLRADLNAVLKRFDHKNLNDVAPFESSNPTSELLAKEIFRSLIKKINNQRVTVHKVTVCESRGAAAAYFK